MADYTPLVQIFRDKIKTYQENGKKIFASSSFQSHSLPMLHLISQIDASIPVYFLNTGYHFAETLAFKEEVARQFGLQLQEAASPIPKIAQRDANGLLFFAKDPDYCCYLNKTLPMEPMLAAYDVWISGVRRDQNANRSRFEYEMPGKYGTLRFHPMLEWTNAMIARYLKDHQLPQHPLEGKGYLSVGCEPCTQSVAQMNAQNEREGRWAGLKKTECGLHTDLVAQ
ncbi:MAG: phosphoadenylyl-sulfate reductase [Microscillaceae bacterium]|nr:phosphoadenylyl-sulfate reductase [Microscillaceae bacterium]